MYGAWELNSPIVFVNEKTPTIQDGTRPLLFDSGTSNVYFDARTTEAIYALISPDIKPYAAEFGAHGVACNAIDSLTAVMNFTFTSIEGERFNLTVPSSELNTGPFEDDTSMCQTLVNAYSGSDFVSGENLLKYYYSMWDVDNQKLGFSPSIIGK
ncbi:hypothetical protein AcW2_006955 [Taiwanofungus camphoratus]|nr:hypothetical protein AcW2_006955 [Antrodia cinnamomea]